MTKLQKTVIEQLGFDPDDYPENEELTSILRDVSRSSADAGWPGFIYYSETRDFADNNRAEIIEALDSLADDLGEKSVSLVIGFNCLNDDDETYKAVVRYLGGGSYAEDDATMDCASVWNAMAWFALETVANELEG